MTRYVYLAGPMTGVPYNKAQSWRAAVVDAFYALTEDELDVTFLDPLRGLVATLGQDKTIYALGEFPATAEYGRQRDMMDIRRSDLVVVGGLDTSQAVSIGTMMEMGMCMAWGKPIILQGYHLSKTVHRHPWISGGTQFRTHNPEQTAELIHYLMMERESPPEPEKEPQYANYDRNPSGEGGNIVPLARTGETQSDPVYPRVVASGVDSDRGVRQTDASAYPPSDPDHD